MREYAKFVDELRVLFDRAKLNSSPFERDISSATNGLAKSKLYRLVPVAKRREIGAFFTDEETARFASRFLKRDIERGAIVCDPACGAGDLLLACTEYMMPSGDLRSTLRVWGSRFAGWDLENSFVDACRLRLALKCIERTRSHMRSTTATPDFFTGVQVQDGLLQSHALEEVDAVIMNPPFTMMQAPKNLEWAQGTINKSAFFLERVVSHTSIGTKTVAILPDVLRSGSRYNKWRQRISQLVNVERAVPLQRFDASTDVHVFVLVATRKKFAETLSPPNWLLNAAKERFSSDRETSIEDLFDVSVGPLVEYREPKRGPWLPYLTARDLPAWQKVSGILPKRRFKGRRVKAPFVVVRRTSRPEDRYRAVGTIIGGRAEYAVENHLIILKPKDDRLRSCQSLLEQLKRPETSEFLNHVIRCRHLTVSAVKSIPWARTCEQR